jgi:hypothetical protein
MADSETTTEYQVERRGFLHPEHHFRSAEGPIGVLTLTRGKGMILGGRWSPVSGEVVTLRRDPGLLRSQFSLWTEGQEWLGSSLRGHFLRREILLHTGSRPLRMLPLREFQSGWVLQAPKTGDMARFRLPLLSQAGRIEVYRKLEFELVVFAYFLAAQLRLESLWPGPVEAAGRSAARLAG